jgi:hypothetical protein
VYQNQTAGFIFRDLFLLAAGSPLSAGTIDNGPIISTFLIEDYPTIAAVFDRLTTENENQYIWYVDSTTLTINFAPPGVIAAPFTPQTTDILYENFSVRFDRQDFRNRQTIKLEYDAFGRSDEVFTGSGQQAFTLRNPVHDVTNAWITKNTANTATGTFTGIPKAGDTVTVSYPSTGSVYNWAASSPYFVGYQILDPNNHIQQVASVNAGLAYPGVPNSGKSGTTEPSWNDAGGTTNDYGVTWQDKGSLGGALYVVQTYNFVSTLDNAQAGEVLIGGTAADSAQNLCDAINASVQYEFSTSPVVYKGPGLNYSLPTWENRLLNCDQPSGATITVRNKYVGKGFVAALSSSSEAFSWSASQTSGGVTTFGTNSISVGLTTAQSGGSGSNLPSLSYTPGLNTVYLSSPLNVGTYLAVEYHRLDGDLISVENTALVTYRANIEQSTGKYQALTSDSSATPIQGLVEAQQALLAFEAMPEFLEFLTFRPGLQPGMLLTLGFNEPQGPQLKAPQSLTGSTITGTITIDSTQCGSVNSTQWTFLFSQTDPNLRTVANGGYAQNSNGYDITFTSDIYGLNPLTWEVEYYNPVTGQMIAWVLLPLLSVSNNTQLYVQVGNSSITSFQGGGVGAAWNNYNAVYHFAGAGPSMSDSTGGGNTATNYGATPTTFAQGQIDGAV